MFFPPVFRVFARMIFYLLTDTSRVTISTVKILSPARFSFLDVMNFNFYFYFLSESFLKKNRAPVFPALPSLQSYPYTLFSSVAFNLKIQCSKCILKILLVYGQFSSRLIFIEHVSPPDLKQNQRHVIKKTILPRSFFSLDLSPFVFFSSSQFHLRDSCKKKKKALRYKAGHVCIDQRI